MSEVLEVNLYAGAAGEAVPRARSKALRGVLAALNWFHLGRGY